MKKLSLIFAAIILLINTIGPNLVHAAADVSFPALESVSVDKATVAAGESVMVSVKATDNEGVASVYVYYKKPITGVSMQVRLYYNAETDLFEKEIPLDTFYEMGVYKISTISVVDNSGNSVNFYDHQDTEKKLEKGQFEFLGPSEADTTFPVIESISVSQNTITEGDTLTVSLEARDDAEISTAYVYYKKPLTENFMQLRMEYNPETDRYEKVIPVDSNFETGVYKVATISVEDSSGINTVLYDHQDSEGLLETGQFEYVGESEADTIFPVIESIKVNKYKVLNGDTLSVSMKASDSSGISEAYVYYKAPITGNWIQMRLNYNDSTGTWEKGIPVNSGLESGVYKISTATVTDNSGNRTVIYDHQDTENLLGSGQFRYISETNLPEFTSISTNVNEVESGDDITFNVVAADDTGLQEAIIHYVSPETQTRQSVNMEYNEEAGNFQGSLPIDMETEVGLWKVESLEIIDVNLNKLTVSSNLSSGNYNVIPPVKALDEYIVTSSETWSDKTVDSDVYISPGSVLTVEGNVTINGDIYVVGGFRSTGGLTLNGELHASYMTFGYYYPSDGQAIISGSNSITSTIISSKLLDEVPFTIHDTPIIGKGDSVNFTGATLPFVRVTINGQPIDLKENGTFRIKGFDLEGQEILQVKMRDTQGYEHTKSFEVHELYVDEITKDTTIIKGKTQPLVKVVLTDNGQKLGEATSDGNGYFQLVVSGLKENATLTFEATGLDGISITKKNVVVPDTTPPNMPTVESVYDTSTSVKGTTEPNATVTVKDGSNELGTGEADEAGEFTISIPKQAAGTELAIMATDKAGNESKYTVITVEDKTPPVKPEVNAVSDQSTTVTGTTEANAAVVVKTGTTEIGKGTADGTGEYSVTIAKQKAETEITVFATDQAGNQSEPTVIKVEDKTAPAKPEVNAVSDQSTTVTGTTEANAAVVVKSSTTEIGKGTADGTGKYSVTIAKQKAGIELTVFATDQAGNSGESTIVKVADKTPPVKPEVNAVSDQSTTVTGTTEADAAVVVKTGTTEIGKGTADGTGKYNITIAKQKAGTEITVFATDQAGNRSESTVVTVEDKTAPSWPTGGKLEISKVKDTSLLLKWPNPTDIVEVVSYVLYQNNTELKSFSVDTNSFQIEDLVYENKYTFKVVAIDKAGNKSASLVGEAVTIKDETPPTWPETSNITVTETTDTTFSVTWTKATDENTIKEYRCMLNGVESKVTTVNKCTFSGLNAGTNYEVKIEALDQYSNKTSNGPSLTVRTKGAARISGASRYNTAVEISKSGWGKAETVILARGDNFPDALAGAPLAYKLNAPILLTDQNSLSFATKEEINRLGAKKVIILGGPSAVSSQVADDVKALGITVERIYGNGRSETANEIAKKLGKSNKVILAYGYNFPDALAVASYAAQNGYPILLTNKNDIAASTRQLIKEFGKDQVIVVGGESVITKKMIQSLEMSNIKRIAGNNRFETAANIINQLKLDVENVYIANGYGFADALTGSVLAAKNNAPMLLVNSDSLPWATQNMITKYPSANYNILGGPSAVNQEIVESLKGTGTGALSQ